MPLNVPTTPATGPIGFTYAENTDLDIRWGKKNIDKWADADNDNDADKILTRRGWALARAERYINSRLKGYLYTVPFEAFPATPPEITDLVVTFAGIYLYQSPRGLADGEDTQAAMQVEKDDVELYIRNILGGVVRLTNVTISTQHPEVYPITEIPVQENIITQ